MRISDWSSDVCSSVLAAVDARDDFGGQGDGIALDRDRAGQRRERRLQYRGGAVIVLLVERMDGAEIAAQAQLPRIARWHRFDLCEPAVGFGEFAEVRFLPRAAQGEFAGA